METITRGSRSRVGSVLVDEKMQFFVENAWMHDFARRLARTLLNQRFQCGVNDLYPRVGRENFGALFDFISQSKTMLQLHAFALGLLF